VLMSPQSFTDAKPTLVRRENGGWLAISPADLPLHIGVEAWSADDARDRFVRAAREWSLLLYGQVEDAATVS